MGVHDGHRKRMKARFRERGPDELRDHELLELLLFYAIPRSNTNELAHGLLERFGSLRGVLDAPIEALCTIPGVGEHAAMLLKATAAVHRRVLLRDADEARVMETSDDAAAFLMPRFRGLDCECVYVLCLDSRKRIICCEELARGVPTQVDISVRQVVELALRNGAQGVILSHNHPNAPALPSREDEMVTLQVSRALATIGITLVDHIILSDSEYLSMADSGALSAARSPFQSPLY